MKQGLKKVAARLPITWQQELKRYYFSRQIQNGSFNTHEPEYQRLPSLVSQGDWVLDVGANIGHYSIRLSELVGEMGRVISFEPVPDTFQLLAANAALARHRNITLINAAASSASGTSRMDIPKFGDSGLDNYYRAHLSNGAPGSGLEVFCLPIDSLELPKSIRLVKIDAEGHELAVIQGMKELLERDHPILILEDNDSEVVDVLGEFGYLSEKVPGSCNRVFRFSSDSRVL